ncbi:MAG: exodeoxyribonuclease III [Chloroflexota bacterium]
MRIATWNVNSLKARQDKVVGWLARAAPDILLIQETKLGDDDAPVMAFAMLGYDLVHHGEGRWNGVAIAVRQGLGVTDVVTNFGDGPVRDSGPGAAVAVSEEDFDPLDEARMVSAVVDPGGTAGGPIRVVSLYAPNGRVVGSPFFAGKLRWYERLERWLREACSPDEPVVVGGDFNLAPTDDDVWDAAAVHGGTHVSEPERAAFRALLDWGLIDAYRRMSHEPGRFTWWDYRAGNFHKNLGMRIDHVLVTRPIAERIVFAEIDREARKGPPIPSDHAPLVVDLDTLGKPFDADWDGALLRIAARSRPARR